MYSKYGMKEEERSYRNASLRPNSADAAVDSINMFENPRLLSSQGNNDQTLRSPEESTHLSTLFMPKEIPSSASCLPNLLDSHLLTVKDNAIPSVLSLMGSPNKGLFKQHQDQQTFNNRPSSRDRESEVTSSSCLAGVSAEPLTRKAASSLPPLDISPYLGSLLRGTPKTKQTCLGYSQQLNHKIPKFKPKVTNDKKSSTNEKAQIIDTIEVEDSLSPPNETEKKSFINNTAATGPENPSEVVVDIAEIKASINQDPTRQQQRKTRSRRSRTNDGVHPELARLHENITERMKTVETEGRRSRSRLSQRHILEETSLKNKTTDPSSYDKPKRSLVGEAKSRNTKSIQAPSKNGIKHHCPSKHAPSDKHFDSVNSQPEGKTTVNVTYKCLYCGFKDQLKEEVKKHSLSDHKDVKPKISRTTTKVRSPGYIAEAAVDSNTSTSEPPAKKTHQDLDAKIISNPMKSSPEVETLKRAVNAQVSSKSNNETASLIGQHDANHPPDVTLRYAYLDTSIINIDSNSPEETRSAVGIEQVRFLCPVCVPQKDFTSLENLQSHSVEHKKVWKCFHCPMLFGTPEQSLYHWKDGHPNLRGYIQTIDDSNQIAEMLTKEIKLI